MGTSIEPRRRTGRRRVLASTALTAALLDLDKMMALGSARIFGLRELDHPLADALGRVTADMLGESRGSLAGRDG